ncbi:phosphoribosyl 1,2-cyclic phosphodiesterase [Breznakibacter xylanolyticus]|uniref:Phosphoribosyl 1,2-cyclic phosphodiesterase n=1 Tax=Breznakibacter xylanolyticus TaxID=990 RepID=A0A2W7NCN9_9BACT|nr:MBL fold metallo-hydrolase [Breznakibacter xylanolyticus]PZX17928.1 phosphoribosyl 1,2-cyclic phosphodiesterase [Breznakibacter xylanolyticus]
MVQICALASGSNGNCYYVGNEHDAVLVDVGVSRRQVLDRMKKVGLSEQKIRAIFITHEHSDHSRGVKLLSQKLKVPVFMSPGTFNRCYDANRPDVYTPFSPGQEVGVASLRIHTFLKYHDAAEPCSFVVQSAQVCVGVMTDIGEPCDNVKQHVAMCDAIFLESNYDERMLWDGNYPLFLKNRVSSRHGHLSNAQALELVDTHAGPRLKMVYLSHLSEENNHPTLAMKCFEPLQERYRIELTNRYAPSSVAVLNA